MDTAKLPDHLLPRALAVDIGGTKMSAALIDASGCIIGEVITDPVPFTRDGQADARKMLAWIKARRNEYPGDLCGIGLSLCGNVDEDTGFVPLSANFHWYRVPFGRMVADEIGLPVMAATDVRMAALAEATWGAAKGVNFFAWVTIGTGYGGYLVLDGKLYRGFHGYAGNFGHNTWDEFNGELCGCGKPGCIETFVSGPGIGRGGQQLADSGASQMLAQLCKGKAITSKDVFEAARQGDPGSRAVLDEALRLTAINLASLVNILDLEMLVIGGGVAHAAEDYVDRLGQKVRQYLMTEEAKRDLKVVRESFSNAALVGAGCDVFLRTGIHSFGEGK
jgi:glucokinase